MRRIVATLATMACVLFAIPLLTAPAEASAGVKRAQSRLNQLGCQAGPVDGEFGEWTKAAVIRFQSRHGMEQSGRLSAAVNRRLYAATAKRCDVRPVPARSGSGRRIVISQYQNWVWLVRANGTVVKQGGMIDNPAELGKGWHRVGSYCGRAAKIRNNSSSGGLRLENFTRFSPCGIGFHRIPQYRPSGRQIHADQLLGTNLRRSHGCIRVSAAMGRAIWDFGTVGTRVRVK